jgi:hypothetical protein
MGFITARLNCDLGWFVESLCKQLTPVDEVEVIVIDGHMEGNSPLRQYGKIKLGFFEPKPTNFSGRYRVTKDSWWSKASAINTFLCYANHDHVVMVDDRLVLGPRWMEAIRDAVRGNYAMTGAYQKRREMTVVDGVIRHSGIITGEDHRTGPETAVPVGHSWFFGCCNAMPLEFWLEMNGAPERTDGMGSEDIFIGILLHNNGHQVFLDRRALVIEDRTPGEFSLGYPIRRTTKEKFPYDFSDKCHTLIRDVQGQKQSINGYDIRELRLRIRSGEKFPLPNPDQLDWFDGAPIKDYV